MIFLVLQHLLKSCGLGFSNTLLGVQGVAATGISLTGWLLTSNMAWGAQMHSICFHGASCLQRQHVFHRHSIRGIVQPRQ
jgi:hypothetical protein